MFKIILTACAVTLTFSAIAVAAISMRFERIVSPPQIEIQISTAPQFQTRMLPFPMSGPFAKDELTAAQVQKLVQDFDISKKR